MVLGALIVILVLLVIYSIYSQCRLSTPKAEQAASSNNKQDEESTSSIELVERPAYISNGGLHLKSTSSSSTAAAIERARSASGRSLPPPIPHPLNLWDEPLGAPTYAPHGIDEDEEAWCKENASDWRVVEEPKEAATRDWRVVEDEPPPTSPQREEDLYDFGDDDARLPASAMKTRSRKMMRTRGRMQ